MVKAVAIEEFWDTAKLANQRVDVSANRGRRYLVKFDDAGSPYCVQVATRGSYRIVWVSGGKHSPAAKCAINAAVSKLKAWR